MKKFLNNSVFLRCTIVVLLFIMFLFNPTVADAEEKEVMIKIGSYGSNGDFDLMYLPNSSEFVCMRDGKEIGIRVCESKDIVGSFLKHLYSEYNTTGYLHNNSLIYPLFIKEGDSISFHLYTVTTFKTQPILTWNDYINSIRYDDIDYEIYDGKVYRFSEGLNISSDRFLEPNTTNEKIYNAKSAIGCLEIPLIDSPYGNLLLDSELNILINVNVLSDDMLSPNNIEMCHTCGPLYDSETVVICCKREKACLYAKASQSNTSIKEMIQDGVFPEYKSNEGPYYIFENWKQAKEVLDYTQTH